MSTITREDATARRSLVRFTTDGLTRVHYAAMGLSGISAAVHLYLYYVGGFLPFLLAGAGFLGAIGLLLVLPEHRTWIYAAGVPYTLVQMVGWVAAGMPDFALGVADKVVQVALVALLVVLFRRERRAGAVDSTADGEPATAEPVR